MKRTVFIAFVLVALSALTCMAYAEDRNGDGNALDQLGGTYCAGAYEIPSGTTNFIDTGYLDLDNDCSAPFAWPYNDIFYKFNPAVSGVYIFKLQLGQPSTNAALRIMANACCSGGTTVNALNDQLVTADCDTGRTLYLRATLNAGTWYWFHIGDNTNIAHDSHFLFQMLFVECPRMDTTAVHSTCGTAMALAPNDSIRGDSATMEHPDWYQFTIPANMQFAQVTISVVGREFGHCNTGFFPQCFINPLNARFFLYCGCPADNGTDLLIAEGNDELCSTDAQVTACLPGAGETYYIKVANLEGESWVGWDYILIINTVPTQEVCTLPPACGEQEFNCPTGGDQIVNLLPVTPPPEFRLAYQSCVHLDGSMDSTTIIVPGTVPEDTPTIVMTPGCANCQNNPPLDCGPLPLDLIGQSGWVYNPALNVWTNRMVSHAPAGTDLCCLCIEVDFLLPVELISFTATARDGQIGLTWVTASETDNDHFELARDGRTVANVPGAGSSTDRHVYHWTDEGLVNYVDHTYTLVSVDIAGDRHVMGTVTAHAQPSVEVVTEYALRQNYPNPFNPATSIGFDLVEAGYVSLKVYNLMGQEAATLVSGQLTSGRHEVSFDASALPSGIYLYRLTAGTFAAEKKMLLIK